MSTSTELDDIRARVTALEALCARIAKLIRSEAGVALATELEPIRKAAKRV